MLLITKKLHRPDLLISPSNFPVRLRMIVQNACPPIMESTRTFRWWVKWLWEESSLLKKRNERPFLYESSQHSYMVSDIYLVYSATIISCRHYITLHHVPSRSQDRITGVDMKVRDYLKQGVKRVVRECACCIFQFDNHKVSCIFVKIMSHPHELRRVTLLAVR